MNRPRLVRMCGGGTLEHAAAVIYDGARGPYARRELLRVARSVRPRFVEGAVISDLLGWAIAWGWER